jgi:hypothetical protein
MLVILKKLKGLNLFKRIKMLRWYRESEPEQIDITPYAGSPYKSPDGPLKGLK